ncbi:NB-ARC domain-containing protein [Actinophytocola sp. NPDC049390]|uniref:NB-ARC domain-containing protein n=1 Tax=Actinophytocola sp. NPDC049390 TaxID=3363894 RepID=UPI0037A873D8
MSGAEQVNSVEGTVVGAVLQARTVTADTIVMQAPSTRVPVPRQLPPPVRTWVDRTVELERLDTLLAAAEPVRVVVTGLAGVGKTGLAVRWLDRHREHFRDGVLHVDLNGWSGHTPPTTRQVLAGWLRALGLSADEVPGDLAELTALYRTMTSDRTLAVLVDNARSTEQVQPLVPAAARGTILVTSRHRLAPLAVAGFRHIDLDCFPTPTGAVLLAGLLDEDRQPVGADMLHALAARCHGHPLALTMAGAHLAAHPRRDPARLLTRLNHHPPGQSSPLQAHALPVEGVLQMSYEDLDTATARLYRSLAEHPGAEFTADPLAAGLDVPVADVEQGLGRLLEGNFVTETRDERYRLHDVVRHHVRALADQDDEEARLAIRRRIIEWYLRRTAAADKVINPFPRRFSPVYTDLDTGIFPDTKAALDWVELERANLLAAQTVADDCGWSELVYQFGEVLWNPLRPNYTAAELVQSQFLGANAAADAGHILEIVCRTRQGFGETNLGHHEAAITICTVAVQRATEVGDPWLESGALSTRARAYLKADDPHAARADLERSLTIAEDMHDGRSVALRHRRLGETALHPKSTDAKLAGHHLRLAANMFAGIGDHIGHARTVLHLARALTLNEQPFEALSELTVIEQAVRDYGSIGYLADLCTALGQVHVALGDIAEARRHYDEAINHYTAAGPGADKGKTAVIALRAALDSDQPTA